MSGNAQALTRLGQFTARLKGLANELERPNFYPLCVRLAKDLAKFTDDLFEYEMDPNGHLWEPTMVSIKERRKTLQDTGMMRAGIRFTAGKDSVTGVSPQPYSYFIQGGFRRRSTEQTMPERLFLAWGKNNIALVEDGIVAYVDETVAKYFGGTAAWKPRTYFSQVV